MQQEISADNAIRVRQSIESDITTVKQKIQEQILTNHPYVERQPEHLIWMIEWVANKMLCTAATEKTGYANPAATDICHMHWE